MTDQPAPKPLEPEDFYFNEQGLMVLTEASLRKRGFCCQNGCRHCPYGFKDDRKKSTNEAPSS